MQTEEQRMIRDMVREFAEAELDALAPRLDEERRFPAESVPKMAALELFGLAVPQEHGGAGVDAVAYALAIEEVARVCGSTALVLAAHNSLAARSVYRWGNDAQRRRFLPALARGEIVGAFALAEEHAGSDAGALQTSASRRDGGFVLQGTKRFVANATHAGLFVVAARSETGEAGEHGISLFLVERERAGVTPGTPEAELGLRGAGIGPVQLDGVEIPAENLLGEPGAGFEMCAEAMRDGALAVAALAVGLAQGAFERALRYARERPQFGRPIADFEAIQWRLVDMATEIHAARLLVHDAARRREAGDVAAGQVAMAKLFAAETATRAGDHAIQIHGGYGYIGEYEVERSYRDAKMCEIAMGTSEMQRFAVAHQLRRHADAGGSLLQ